MATSADHHLLHRFLDEVSGPRGSLPKRDVGLDERVVAAELQRMAAAERAAMLAALSCDHDAFTRRRSDGRAAPASRDGGLLVLAFWRVALEKKGWSASEALACLSALQANPRLRYSSGLRLVRLLNAMDRDGVRIDRSPAADRVFEALDSRATGDTQLGGWHETLHRLFRRPYIPLLRSEFAFDTDPGFTRALDALCRLEQRLLGEEQPDRLVRRILSVIGPVRPIDAVWIAERREAYARWDTAFGERRWIEVLPPATRPELDPALAAHLAGATASKPSGAWAADARALVEAAGSDGRDQLLALLAAFGGAPDVRESERLWLGGAWHYAHLHRLYRRWPVRWDAEGPLTSHDISDLPWRMIDGAVTMPGDTAVNPFRVSEMNMTLLKGANWALADRLDAKSAGAIGLAIGGAAATVETHLGPRTRALAVANAGLWALGRDQQLGEPVLRSLQGSVQHVRVRKAVAAALA